MSNCVGSCVICGGVTAAARVQCTGLEARLVEQHRLVRNAGVLGRHLVAALEKQAVRLLPAPRDDRVYARAAHMMLALWTAVIFLRPLATAWSKANLATRVEASRVMSLMLCTMPSTSCNT